MFLETTTDPKPPTTYLHEFHAKISIYGWEWPHGPREGTCPMAHEQFFSCGAEGPSFTSSLIKTAFSVSQNSQVRGGSRSRSSLVHLRCFCILLSAARAALFWGSKAKACLKSVHNKRYLALWRGLSEVFEKCVYATQKHKFCFLMPTSMTDHLW